MAGGLQNCMANFSKMAGLATLVSIAVE